MHRGYRRAILVTIIARFMCEAYLKNSRFYAIISAEKHVAVPDTRQPQPHKRVCISKTISKNFLDKFLDTGMLYGTGIFRGSNKKEPKTLVNTGVSASFIVCYRPLKFSKFRLVIVPWKPFALWARGFESHTLRQKNALLSIDKGAFFLTKCSASGMWSMLCKRSALRAWSVPSAR